MLSPVVGVWCVCVEVEVEEEGEYGRLGKESLGRENLSVKTRRAKIVEENS